MSNVLIILIIIITGITVILIRVNDNTMCEDHHESRERLHILYNYKNVNYFIFKAHHFVVDYVLKVTH